MIGFILLAAGLAGLCLRLFVYPVILYFVDPKGLRKYENFSWLSPLTDLLNKGKYSRKRRLLSAAFATRNLEKWEFKVRYTTQRLLDAFDTRCTAPLKPNTDPDPDDLTVDFNKWINLWTIEAINYIALSAKMTLLDTGTDEVIAEKPDGRLYPARYRQAQNHSAIGKVVAKTSAIIDTGAETTAIALTHILQLLISHPKQLQKLREEIAGVMDEDDVIIPFNKVKDLPYLKAYLNKGLRLIPPISSGLPRHTPPEGARIIDTWIPGDTSMSITIWSAHHNKDIFPKPYAFQPERWLNSAERKRIKPFFIPFSAGARGCIRRNISYLEQQIILSTLVLHYDFAMPTEGFKVSRFEAFNLIMGELPIKIWRR
ncbi:hypothetical protein FSHL1_006855 [Fusarium sambucinum]